MIIENMSLPHASEKPHFSQSLLLKMMNPILWHPLQRIPNSRNIQTRTESDFTWHIKKMTTHARSNLTKAKGGALFIISRGAQMISNMRPAGAAVFTEERR